ncbi:hypothetical protein KP509_33G018800 [Ceratopteris richardii]|uniref:Fe2OG dioxygenase domain-containing protein n=1 Tax=Ceratopteris richardii TaxID=49495 RepID=A0A8T2QNX9_CERRI|nr:hypothetical protein KP509_33G018800 [Ceratopteris richardii]
MGYLDAQEGDAERTAFRRAEKRYKFYKHSSTSARSIKHRESVPPTDLSDVIDFRKIRHLGFSTESGIKMDDKNFQWPVFTMEQHPGFYFIPEALGIEEQMHWIKESLTTFPQPPNRTNHTAVYGPIFDLWNRAQKGESTVLPMKKKETHKHCPIPRTPFLDHLSPISTEIDCANGLSDLSETTSDNTPDNESNKNSADGKSYIDANGAISGEQQHSTSIPLSVLLRKLRWATLGLQFDWSKRAYDLSLPYNKMPQKLCDLASKLAEPAMPDSEFHAEAAIVNYFGQDDMLGGHLDDMEKDWSKPIVSISFGCKAIFLLGGPTREHKPTAMFLRSGDVVLMAGPARGCFHGVPRIFVDPKQADLPDFSTCDPSCKTFIDYINRSRINLNIRQVF